MKILAINGSHRGGKGYTEFLIQKLFKGATSAGATCESVTLADMDIKRCTGCFSCQRKDRHLKCIYDGMDDISYVYDKIRDADLIIFAIPVYVFNMSSLLKSLLDRYPSTANCNDFRISKSGLFFHQIDKSLCSKPFITIICQDNMENETHRNIVSFFKTYARFMDAKYVGSLVRKSGMLVGRGNDTSQISKYPVLNDIYEAFIDAGKDLAIKGKISRSIQRRANRGLISIPPFIKQFSRIPIFREQIDKISRKRMES